MPKKIDINSKYFSNIEDLQVCYWAGFLAADGCIMPECNKFYLELSYKDVDHLKLFCEHIGYVGKIGERFRKSSSANNTRHSCRIQLNDKQIIEDLVKLGLCKNKTENIKPPEILTGLSLKAFLIGFIDGDGCVTLGKRKGCSFTSTNLIITVKSDSFRKWFTDKIFEFFNIKNYCEHGINIIYNGKYADAVLEEFDKIEVLKLNRKWNIRGQTMIKSGKCKMVKMSKPQRKIPLADYKNILHRYLNGETQISIAKKYNVNKNTINRIIGKIKDNADYVDMEEVG